MVRPVSLSDPAFAALRKEKKEGESDSDVVLRLVREARAKRKDALRFYRNRHKHKMIWTPEEFDEFRRKMDEADREKVRRLWDAGR